MTFTKGISRSTFQGLLTGSLLAATTLIWLNSSNPYYLPALVTLWWLIIFGSNLLHSYLLSNQTYTNGKRFSLQFVHAAVAALAYWGIDFFVAVRDIDQAAATKADPVVLLASVPQNIDTLVSDAMLVVPAAFILSLVTGGLLFSILTHPSAK